MTRNAGKTQMNEIYNKLEHAIFHLKQSGIDSEDGRSGLSGVEAAFRCLKEALCRDVVYASTAVEWDDTSKGNVIGGVTAHCACGRVFTDDVRFACANL